MIKALLLLCCLLLLQACSPKKLGGEKKSDDGNKDKPSIVTDASLIQGFQGRWQTKSVAQLIDEEGRCDFQIDLEISIKRMRLYQLEIQCEEQQFPLILPYELQLRRAKDLDNVFEPNNLERPKDAYLLVLPRSNSSWEAKGWVNLKEMKLRLVDLGLELSVKIQEGKFVVDKLLIGQGELLLENSSFVQVNSNFIRADRRSLLDFELPEDAVIATSRANANFLFCRNQENPSMISYFHIGGRSYQGNNLLMGEFGRVDTDQASTLFTLYGMRDGVYESNSLGAFYSLNTFGGDGIRHNVRIFTNNFVTARAIWKYQVASGRHLERCYFLQNDLYASGDYGWTP